MLQSSKSSITTLYEYLKLEFAKCESHLQNVLDISEVNVFIVAILRVVEYK